VSIIVGFDYAGRYFSGFISFTLRQPYVFFSLLTFSDEIFHFDWWWLIISFLRLLWRWCDIADAASIRWFRLIFDCGGAFFLRWAVASSFYAADDYFRLISIFDTPFIMCRGKIRRPPLSASISLFRGADYAAIFFAFDYADYFSFSLLMRRRNIIWWLFFISFFSSRGFLSCFISHGATRCEGPDYRDILCRSLIFLITDSISIDFSIIFVASSFRGHGFLSPIRPLFRHFIFIYFSASSIISFSPRVGIFLIFHFHYFSLSHFFRFHFRIDYFRFDVAADDFFNISLLSRFLRLIFLHFSRSFDAEFHDVWPIIIAAWFSDFSSIWPISFSTWLISIIFSASRGCASITFISLRNISSPSMRASRYWCFRFISFDRLFIFFECRRLRFIFLRFDVDYFFFSSFFHIFFSIFRRRLFSLPLIIWCCDEFSDDDESLRELIADIFIIIIIDVCAGEDDVESGALLLM